MNPEARAELDRIVALDPNDATESDIAFLRARRTYLTEEQRIKLDIVETQIVSGDTEAQDAAKRAKSKPSRSKTSES